MSEQTGIEAKTIHRLLETDPKNGGFKRNAENRLDCDLLVIDETSMLDTSLMFALMKAIPPQAALLLVGDVDQLPSVGPGQVLADVINSGAIPVARLTEVFRQAAESRIVVNAHRINRGEMPEWTKAGEDSDFYFVEADDPEDGAAKVVHIVRDRIPRRFGLDPVRDIQVLCPMQRGALGARALNVDLQNALNPNMGEKIERFGSAFAPGDKVMQTENDYDREVFNGDLGRVHAHRPDRRRSDRRLRRARGRISVRRTRRARSRLRDDDPQVAGLGIPRRGDHAGEAALHDARQEPGLYGGHPGQAPGRHRRAAQGTGHRRPQPWIEAAVDEAPGMAGGERGAGMIDAHHLCSHTKPNSC